MGPSATEGPCRHPKWRPRWRPSWILQKVEITKTRLKLKNVYARQVKFDLERYSMLMMSFIVAIATDFPQSLPKRG